MLTCRSNPGSVESFVSGVHHGPARQLKGLLASFPCDLSGRRRRPAQSRHQRGRPDDCSQAEPQPERKVVRGAHEEIEGSGPAQREMLLLISGKDPAKAKDISKETKKAEKPARTTARGRADSDP
jgi:hypothetical protein